MDRNLLLITIFLSAILCATAQKKPSDSELLKEIQQSDNYIYGVGQAESIDEASQKALADLVSKITTDVESNFNYLLISQQENDNLTTNVDVKNVVKTYSRLTLNNAQQIIVPYKKKDKMRTVYRYITKADLEAMYNKRGEKARHYVNIARRATKSNEPGKALQNYSWALALLMSYPDGNTLQLDDDDFNKQYAYSWIPLRMKELLRKVSINVNSVNTDKSVEENTVNLSVLYDGSPANDLLITFAVTGDSSPWSETLTPTNGKIPLYVPANINLRKLVANIRCANKVEASVDPDVAAVIGILDYINFNEAVIKFGRQISETKSAAEHGSQARTDRRDDPQPTVNIARSVNVQPAVSAAETNNTGGDKSAQPEASQDKTETASKPRPATGPLYTYKGETAAGKPDGEGIMTFNHDGVFEGIQVQQGDSLRGFFLDGHIYMVDHYSSDGTLKKANISGGM